MHLYRNVLTKFLSDSHSECPLIRQIITYVKKQSWYLIILKQLWTIHSDFALKIVA